MTPIRLESAPVNSTAHAGADVTSTDVSRLNHNQRKQEIGRGPKNEDVKFRTVFTKKTALRRASNQLFRHVSEA